MKSLSTIKYKIGLVLIAFSCVMPVCAFVIPFLGFSTATTTFITGMFLIGAPELFFVLGVFLAGKDAVGLLKQKLWKPAGKIRYLLGLALFVICILINWVCVYIELTEVFPYNLYVQLCLMATFDLLLILSMFIMGPEFFIKIRSIFSWEGVKKADK